MNLKQKLVLFLSDPEISEREFRDIRRWLTDGGIFECLQDAETIRSMLRSYRSVPSKVVHVSEDSSEHRILSEIDHILRFEAGLTARVALEELKEATQYGGNLPDRISFADGVRRMIKEIGASEVLNTAYQIRNRKANQTESLAWPLNRDR